MGKRAKTPRARRALMRLSGWQHCHKCGGDREHLDAKCLTCHPRHAYGLRFVPAHLLPYIPGGSA